MEEFLKHLREDRWTKGAIQNIYGENCLLGFIILYGGHNKVQIRDAFRKAIAELYPQYYWPYITSFNDDPSTIWKDIERVARRAQKIYPTLFR